MQPAASTIVQAHHSGPSDPAKLLHHFHYVFGMHYRRHMEFSIAPRQSCVHLGRFCLV